MRYLSCVANYFGDRPDGAARVAWDIARLMARRDHEATLACFGAQPARNGPEVVYHENVRVVRIPCQRPHWAVDPIPFFTRTMEKGLREALGDEPFDVVHAHLVHFHIAARRALGKGPRYVLTLHSPIVDEQRVRWASGGWKGYLKRWLGLSRLRRLEREALQDADAVHVLSEFSRYRIEATHSLAERATVIPHWQPDGDRRWLDKAAAKHELGWPTDRPIVLTLRRHAPRMGLDLAIDAIGPLAADARCCFVVAGDGPLRASLQAKARLYTDEPTPIQFPGHLDEHELALAYQGADLFVLPSSALECFGLITLEAMAFGCPVLATDAGATPELLAPVAPQLIVPANDTAALRERAESFLDKSLDIPAASDLTRHVERFYGPATIEPRILSFLLGDQFQAQA